MRRIITPSEIVLILRSAVRRVSPFETPPAAALYGEGTQDGNAYENALPCRASRSTRAGIARGARMTSLIFLLLAAAMSVAWRGGRQGGLVLFAIAAALALFWFKHHVTDALALDF
jgi:hypothetical protein